MVQLIRGDCERDGATHYDPALAMADSPDDTSLPEHLALGCGAAAEFATALRSAITEACPREFGLRSLARRLSITTTLAASALRVLNAPDPVSVLAALPGGRGRHSLVRTLDAAGVSRATFDALSTALDRLDAVLERDGHDRETLRAFVSERAGPGHARAHAARGLKAAFESASNLWGVRLRNLVMSMWLVPSSDGIHCHAAGGQLFQGLERLRPGPRVTICWAPMTTGKDGTYEDLGCNPAPLGSVMHSPVVDALGSPNLARAEVEVNSNGEVLFGTPERSRGGILDVGVAYVLNDIGVVRADHVSDCGENNVNVSVPMESLVSEVWMHRDLARGGDPAAAYYNIAVRSGSGPNGREHRRVPLHERAESSSWPCALPAQMADLDARYRDLSHRLASQLGAAP